MAFIKISSRQNRAQRLSKKTKRTKIGAAEHSALLRKVTIIRNRAHYSQTSNESLARRTVAEKLVTPRLKQVLGKHLKAVLIAGSAQTGVSKATLKNSQNPFKLLAKSDLDMLAVVDPASVRSKESDPIMTANHYLKWRHQIEQECMNIYRAGKQFGFDIQIVLLFSKKSKGLLNAVEFKEGNGSTADAFQPIYGISWVHKNLSRDFLQRKLPSLVLKQRQKAKYAGRN